MYGVLYAISPEIFPAKDRGTGNGLTSTAARVFGVMVRFYLYSRAASAYHSRLLGPHHCAICKSRYGGACVYRWSTHYICWEFGSLVTI
jgi:hypothetical protein